MPKWGPGDEVKRVLLAGLFHETHTFLDGRTLLADCEVFEGDAMLVGGEPSAAITGALRFAQPCDWHIMPAVYMRAMPGPVVGDEVVEDFWTRLAPHLGQDLDGVLLVLHGAMVSESYCDVEGELLSRIRPVVGEIPICGTLDLHANFTAQMGRCADGLVAYRENPHSDAAQTGERAAMLLDKAMTPGKPLRTVWRQTPIMWPPTGTGTADEPMALLEAAARQIEADHPDIFAVNVLPGFAFADVPDAGLSFTAVTKGDPAEAALALEGLVQLAIPTRGLGDVVGLSVPEAMSKLAKHPSGPVLLVEVSDNIGAGAPGDGTTMLAALVEHGVEGSVAVLNDPKSVALLQGVPVGSMRQLALGGTGSVLAEGPLNLEVELVSTSDGRFDLEDPQSHLASMTGRHVDMGPCAVVRHRGVTVLLTSKKTPPFDLGQLRTQGIVPEAQRVIVVKAAVAHRRAYDPIAKASYWVETPGPCRSDLARLPYRRVRRPIAPLDPI